MFVCISSFLLTPHPETCRVLALLIYRRLVSILRRRCQRRYPICNCCRVVRETRSLVRDPDRRGQDSRGIKTSSIHHFFLVSKFCSSAICHCAALEKSGVGDAGKQANRQEVQLWRRRYDDARYLPPRNQRLYRAASLGRRCKCPLLSEECKADLQYQFMYAA